MDEPQPKYEPSTSFKWPIIAAVVIWSLGAAVILLKFLP
jgi:hypothetical protein